MSDGRGGVPWFKVLMFVMVAIMLAGIVNVILDPGLGRPDDARRTRHPDGFSIGLPVGWGGSVYFGSAREDATIRIAPDRVTGRQTSIVIVRHRGEPPRREESSVDGTFQGRPCQTFTRQGRHDWTHRITFQRDGAWYSITLSSPVPLEPDRNVLTPFVESFRTEAAVRPIVPSTAPSEIQP